MMLSHSAACSCACALFAILTVHAQEIPDRADKGGTISFTLGGELLSNWMRGGDQLVNFGTRNSFHNHRVDSSNDISLEAAATIGYYLDKTEGWSKSDDDLLMTTHWYPRLFDQIYGGIFASLETQLLPGYDPYSGAEVRQRRSALFAPGYTMIGLGLTYRFPSDDFKVAASLVASKQTWMLDPGIDPESFGVEKEKTFRNEIGTLLRCGYSGNISEHASTKASVLLFMNYQTPSLVDVSVRAELNTTVVSGLSILIALQAIYDHDMDIRVYEDLDNDKYQDDFTDITQGIQFKATLGLQMSLDF